MLTPVDAHSYNIAYWHARSVGHTDAEALDWVTRHFGETDMTVLMDQVDGEFKYSCMAEAIHTQFAHQLSYDTADFISNLLHATAIKNDISGDPAIGMLTNSKFPDGSQLILCQFYQIWIPPREES